VVIYTLVIGGVGGSSEPYEPNVYNWSWGRCSVGRYDPPKCCLGGPQCIWTHH